MFIIELFFNSFKSCKSYLIISSSLGSVYNPFSLLAVTLGKGAIPVGVYIKLLLGIYPVRVGKADPLSVSLGTIFLVGLLKSFKLGLDCLSDCWKLGKKLLVSEISSFDRI